ncbi:putative cytochrome P450 [Leptodontidium sp. 2 PMI_412]|nr:putative cytochrome P450 [Leptodontidium sp. 2 PMI_412]
MTYLTFLTSGNLPTICLAFALFYIIYQGATVIYNIYFHPLAKFPGPASRTGVHAGDYWELYKGSHPQSVKELHEKYGDVVRIRPDTLTFNSAAAWKDIYGIRPGKSQLQKDPQFYAITGDTGADIIFSGDADHARMRKLLSHAFSDSALRQQEDLLTPYFSLLVTRLKEQIDGPNAGKVDIKNWYNFLTFDIIGDMSFGESFHALEAGEYHQWMANLFNGVKYARLMAIASFYQPARMILNMIVKCVPAIAAAREEHLSFCRRKTERRLDMDTDRKDFMSYILRHNDEKGMSRQELMKNSELLIIAGSETTATLLSGLTYLLLKTPHAYAKVQEEVRSAFISAEEITLTSTGQLPYLQACLEEAMRMYPPVPIALPRRTQPEGAMIGGHFVPGNTSVAVAQLATYYSKNNFHDPERFAPERWLPNPPEEFRNDVKEAMNPFSTGPRNCIGKNLANNEMRSVMTRMLWHFDMQLCEDSKSWGENQLVYFLWEKPALNVVLSHRADLS